LKARAIAYVLLAFPAIALMMNAPAALVGYGLVFAAAYYAALAFPPLVAASLFAAAHAVADAVMLGSKAAFAIVALASLILRPPVVYVAARLRGRLGALGAAFLLAGLDQLVALSIALSYYGNDGIHVGLAIYELLLAPFAYYAYSYTVREGLGSGARILGVTASLAGLLAYYLGSIVFPLLPAILGGAAAAVILALDPAALGGASSKPALTSAALVVAIVGLALGGQALAYNAGVAFYPFKPSSWGPQRWAEPPGQACPATDNVFKYTHDPPRLRIVRPCVTVTGRVTGAPKIDTDGDYTFDLIPFRESLKSLGLNSLGVGNELLRKGHIHVEVVPHDHFKVLGPLGGGVCPGDVVRVTGVLVADTDHGMWVEVHPALNITVIERASAKPWPDCIRGKLLGG
jgi:hypothetical protein